MKKQLIIYAILIVIFFAYNQFFRVKDDQLNDLINIVFPVFIPIHRIYCLCDFEAIKR